MNKPKNFTKFRNRLTKNNKCTLSILLLVARRFSFCSSSSTSNWFASIASIRWFTSSTKLANNIKRFKLCHKVKHRNELKLETKCSAIASCAPRHRKESLGTIVEAYRTKLLEIIFWNFKHVPFSFLKQLIHLPP